MMRNGVRALITFVLSRSTASADPCTASRPEEKPISQLDLDIEELSLVGIKKTMITSFQELQANASDDSRLSFIQFGENMTLSVGDNAAGSWKDFRPVILEQAFFNLKTTFYPPQPMLFPKGFYLQSCHPDLNQVRIQTEAYCIFSNMEINQAQGMVIISKPTNLLKTLKSVKIDPSPIDDAQNGNDLSSVMKVVKMPTKGGMGAINLNQIEFGQEIINYRSNVLISVEEDILQRSDLKYLKKLAILNLPIATQIEFLNLHGLDTLTTIDKKNQDIHGNFDNLNWLEDRISSIIDLNSFEIKIGENFDLPFFSVKILPSFE